MSPRMPEPLTLYDTLAEPAPEHAVHGETAITRMKETVDRDVEAFELDDITAHGSVRR